MSSAEAENGWWLAAGRGAVRPRVPTRRGLLGPAADIAAEEENAFSPAIQPATWQRAHSYLAFAGRRSARRNDR